MLLDSTNVYSGLIFKVIFKVSEQKPRAKPASNNIVDAMNGLL